MVAIMLSVLVPDPLTLVLLLVLSLAIVSDTLQHRIPNPLTFGALGCGLGLQTWEAGISGFSAGLAGIGIGFLLLLPFYLVNGMRAGDIKLMAAVGAFLGFHTTLAVGFSLMTGMLFGLAVLLWKGGGAAWLNRYRVMFMLFASTGKWSYQPPATGEAAAASFPYAAAIASGTLVTVLVATHSG